MDKFDVSILEQFSKLLHESDTLLSKYLETSPDLAEAAEILAQLNVLKRDVAVVYDSFSGGVAKLMGNLGFIETASGAVVEKKSAVDRKKWMHAELASAVAQRLSEMSIDMDTGERIMTAEQMIQKLLDYAAVSYWRVGKLGELGINPDIYCEQGEHKTNIIVRLGDKNK